MDYGFNRTGWHWAAREFADGLVGASSYPMAYLYGVWLALSGHMLGRRVWMYFPRQMYPNYYVLLIGPSAVGRKSTAMALGYDAIEDLCSFSPPLRTVTTQQGLLQAMHDIGGQTLVLLDEFSSMTAKGKMDFGRDLMQRLVELYDCPKTAATHTKVNPIMVYDPYLTILAASTVDWIQSTVSHSDLMGGLGNRITFILGDERPALAWPGRAHHTLDWTILSLPEGELLPTEEARDLWVTWYTKFDEDQRTTAPFIRTLAQRIPEKIWKAAIIMSAWNGEDIITDGSLEMAIDWGEYLRECLTKIAPAFEDKEKQIFAAIQGGADHRRTLYAELRGHLTSGQIKHGLDRLIWMGAILEDSDGDGYYATVEGVDLDTVIS